MLAVCHDRLQVILNAAWGHAGAIIEGGSGTHGSKVKALREAGITVVENLSDLGLTVARSRKTVSA